MLQNSDWFLNDVEKDTLDLAFHSSGIDQCVSENLFGPRIRRYYVQKCFQPPHVEWFVKNLLANLVSEFQRDQKDISSVPYPEQIKAYIDRHYNEHMRIQDIADYLHLNSHYVTAIFKQKYNKTPKHYLTEIRIEKAKTYLIDTDYSLQIIANAVGLENPFPFPGFLNP